MSPEDWPLYLSWLFLNFSIEISKSEAPKEIDLVSLSAGEFFSRIQDSLTEFARTHASSVITVVAIVLVGFILARLSRRWFGAFLGRTRIKNDPLLKEFFVRSLSFTILLATAMTALEAAGLDVRTVVAGLGITGLLLGFGLRDTLANLASGVLLLIYRPFRAGETIEVEGSQGIVEELTIVNMQMITNDGVRVIMPNSKVWGAKIINYSQTRRRRLELTVKVRDDDIEEAISIAKEALSGYSLFLSDPAPTVRVSSVVDGAAVLTIWVWTLPDRFSEVSGEAYLHLAAAFRKAELPIL